ncbi:MAG: hypothetical protein IJE46_00695 [Clostridia bacterium]|nr:hypothetical protein [Clostridia bacterium]
MDSRNLTTKRITVFAGHYGSGKTNVAVNYALWLKEKESYVSVADLDIVNPYFRTKDSQKMLENNKIRLISSEFAGSNVDTPALPGEIYSVFADKSQHAVLDVGGDDRGALALGRYVPLILEENNYEVLFVINKYRFLTKDAKSTIEVMREIEEASKIKFTAIVNNSNIGEETKEDDVLSSVSYANEVSELSGLDIKMTTVKRSLFGTLNNEIKNLQPIDLYVRQSWLREEQK